jgi:CRP-like cAMP-binding protein
VASSDHAVLGTDLKPEFFDGLSPAELKAVLAAARPRRFFAGSVVIQQGAPADRLYLLTKGRARYFSITPDGRKVPLFWLDPGDVFGGAALLSQPLDYLVSTETVSESCALVWDRKRIRGLAAKCPRLLENALSTASEYLAWYAAAHLALTFPSAEQRLAQVLACLARGIGRHGRHGMELHITNEELAHAANLALFTVSRQMTEWQRQGVVVKGRGKVLLRSPHRLFLSSA